MAFLMLLIGIIGVIIFGYLITKIIYRDSNLLEALSLGFLIGLGLYTYQLFLLNFLGIKFTLENANGILAINILICLSFNFWIYGSFLPSNLNVILPKFSKIQKFLIGLLGVIALGSLITDLYWPVKDWDALVLYDFRAKIFAESGTVQKAIEVMGVDKFIGYPLLTSLAHTYVYLNNVQNPVFLYAFYYLSFLTVSFFVLKKLIGTTKGLLFTLLLACAPQIFDHSTMAYTNLPYTVYLFLGTIYLYLWIKEKKLGYLIIAAILTGLSTWTRTIEPFWLANLGVLVLYFIFQLLKMIYQRKNNRVIVVKIFLPILVYIILFYMLQLPWRLFSASQNYVYENNPAKYAISAVQSASNLNLGIVTKLADYIYRFTILPIVWLFAIFPLALIYQILRKREVWYGFLVFAYMGILLLGAYVFAASYVGWEEIHGSLERMSMFFSPLLIFFAATMFAVNNDKFRK